MTSDEAKDYIREWCPYDRQDEIIKALSNSDKEAYRKGYKDGQKALAVHLELCKEEGSIITVPEGATNGDMIHAIFPHATIRRTPNDICLYVKGQGDAQVFDWAWWNSPYRKEQT